MILISKLVFAALVCFKFCNFVFSESCSEYQYESCCGETKGNYTALLALPDLDWAMRESSVPSTIIVD